MGYSAKVGSFNIDTTKLATETQAIIPPEEYLEALQKPEVMAAAVDRASQYSP